MATPRLFYNSPGRAGRALRAVRGGPWRARGRERALYNEFRVSDCISQTKKSVVQGQMSKKKRHLFPL